MNPITLVHRFMRTVNHQGVAHTPRAWH
jgi:hypothetical protein